MKRLRIVVATRIFAPESGAAAYRLAAMVRVLRERGHEVTVLTSSAPGAPRSTKGISRWPVLRDKTGAVRGYVQYLSFDVPLFFRLLLAKRHDLVIAEPPPTTGAAVRLASSLRGTQYCYFAADVSSVAAEGIGVSPVIVATLRKLERWVLKGAHRVLTVSDGVSGAVQRLGADSNRIVCVGTGIDTEQFTGSGPVSERGRYLVYAGTMSEIQGAGIFVDAFLRIAEEFPDARLLMFGQGVEQEELKRRASSLRQQVRFPGTVDALELSAVMRGAKAGLASVRPAKGYDFAYATKAFASLSCGAPVIYAGVGPMKELVEEESLGYAVPWEPEAVAQAMRAALTADLNKSDRARLTRWVELNHSLSAVGERICSEVERSFLARA